MVPVRTAGVVGVGGVFCGIGKVGLEVGERFDIWMFPKIGVPQNGVFSKYFPSFTPQKKLGNDFSYPDTQCIVYIPTFTIEIKQM